jgi:hypothetical protein
MYICFSFVSPKSKTFIKVAENRQHTPSVSNPATPTEAKASAKVLA